MENTHILFIFWTMRRVEDYLIDFYDTPELMEKVLKTTQKINERYLEAFNESRSQALIINLSGASTSIISPSFFRKWVLPELKGLVSKLNKDKFIGFHLTGKMRDILPIMLEAKPHFILRFESPRFGGDISLKKAKEICGEKICIMGGYDPHLFLTGKLEDMQNEAIRCIDEAAARGGYIFATTDAIPESTKMEDVKAVVNTVKEYGKY